MAMSDTVVTSLRLAWRVVRTAHGREVTFNYGTGSKTLIAVKSRPNAQAVSSDGETIIESNSYDFLIDPADLVIDGVFIKPSEGFEITEQDGTKHRLIPGDSGNLVWRYSDQHKTFIRCFAEEMI